METPGAVPACEEKARLLRAWSFATADYKRSVMLLSARSGTMSREEYYKIKTFAEESRELAEQARAALEKHTHEHGC